MGEAGAVSAERAVAVVRYTMLAGAVYDLAFAVPILAAPGWLSEILHVPMPREEVYLRLLGIFLAALALFYLLPAIYPGRYLGNVAAAAAARALGALFLFAAVAAYGQPRPLLLLGAGDLAFAIVHYASLVPLAGPRVWRAAGSDLGARAPRAAGG
jgi:hypothetical protein